MPVGTVKAMDSGMVTTTGGPEGGVTVMTLSLAIVSVTKA